MLNIFIHMYVLLIPGSIKVGLKYIHILIRAISLLFSLFLETRVYENEAALGFIGNNPS